MKLPHWKVSLSLVAIFLAGTVTGAVLTLRVVKRVAAEQARFERLPDQILARMKSRLALTPEQATRLQPAVAQAARELRELRKQAGASIAQTLNTLDTEIERELLPEQKPKFEQLRRDIRTRLHLRPPAKTGDPAPATPPAAPPTPKP